MQLQNNIRSISYVKSHAADILAQVNDTHSPVVITQNGEAKGVIIDPESYDNMKNTITMLKLISFAENDIKEGKVKTHSKVFSDIKKGLLKKA